MFAVLDTIRFQNMIKFDTKYLYIIYNYLQYLHFNVLSKCCILCRHVLFRVECLLVHEISRTQIHELKSKKTLRQNITRYLSPSLFMSLSFSLSLSLSLSLEMIVSLIVLNDFSHTINCQQKAITTTGHFCHIYTAINKITDTYDLREDCLQY